MSSQDQTIHYQCWNACQPGGACPGHIAAFHYQNTAGTFSVTIDNGEPIWLDRSILEELSWFIQGRVM